MILLPEQNRSAERRALWGLFALLLGSKFLTLAIGASPIPFTDEWDAEGAGFLKPLVEGRNALALWFAHDNEHLIFFTRPLTLLAYRVSGYWDVVLPMILNAILHAAIVTLLLAALTKALPTPKRLAALLLCGGFALLPFGNENTLLGFNTHFYLLIGSALLALWLLASAPAFSPKWLWGVLAAIGAFASLASGALVPLAAAALASAQMFSATRGAPEFSRKREIFGILALVALSGAMIALTPHIPANDLYRAADLPDFLRACVHLLAWPAHGPLGLLLILPGACFARQILREKPALDDPRWLHLGVMIWILGQIAALAYGRSGAIVSRYLDFLVIGVFANIVALFSLMRWRGFARPAELQKFAALVAVALTVALFANHGRVSKLNNVFQRRDEAAAQTRHLRAYLASADARDLQADNKYDLPYPDPERLKLMLDDPTLRGLLPPALDPNRKTRAPVEFFKAAAIASWPLWLTLGLGLWFAALGTRPKIGARISDRPNARRKPRISLAAGESHDQAVMIQG